MIVVKIVLKCIAKVKRGGLEKKIRGIYIHFPGERERIRYIGI